MADLINIPRAILNSTLSALNTSNSAYLSVLITAASDTVRRYCHRHFTQCAFQEYQTVGVQQRMVPIMLREFPVIEVTRVATANQAMIVQNSQPATNQRATVETTTTGITLTTYASGVKMQAVLSYANNVTLQAMATAIAGAGNGWSATILTGINGSYALWPSADLKPLQGAMSAFNSGAYLEIYEDVANSSWGPLDSMNIDGWWGMSGPGWRLDPETGEMWLHVRRGPLVLRIDYTAGFATVPQAVQEACVQITQAMYQQGLANQAYKSVRLGNTDVTLADGQIPKSAKALLDPYVAHDKALGR